MNRSFCPDCYREVISPGRCYLCEFHERRHRLMMGLVVIIGLIALAGSCRGSVITEDFLDRIAQRESGNNPLAIGRHGERGAYQLRPCAVQEVNNTLGWRMPSEVASVKHGRAYARAYCLRIEKLLKVAMRRQPTQPEVYDAYRLGPTGFLRRRGAGQFHGGSSEARTRSLNGFKTSHESGVRWDFSVCELATRHFHQHPNEH